MNTWQIQRLRQIQRMMSEHPILYTMVVLTIGVMLGAAMVVKMMEKPIRPYATAEEGLPGETEVPENNVAGAIILIGALILLVIGIAVLTIRLSRH